MRLSSLLSALRRRPAGPGEDPDRTVRMTLRLGTDAFAGRGEAGAQSVAEGTINVPVDDRRPGFVRDTTVQIVAGAAGALLLAVAALLVPSIGGRGGTVGTPTSSATSSAPADRGALVVTSSTVAPSAPAGSVGSVAPPASLHPAALSVTDGEPSPSRTPQRATTSPAPASPAVEAGTPALGTVVAVAALPSDQGSCVAQVDVKVTAYPAPGRLLQLATSTGNDKGPWTLDGPSNGTTPDGTAYRYGRVVLDQLLKDGAGPVVVRVAVLSVPADAARGATSSDLDASEWVPWTQLQRLMVTGTGSGCTVTLG